MARSWFHGAFKRWFKPSGNQNHAALEILAASMKAVAPRPLNAAQTESLYLLPEDILFMICQYLTRGEVIILMLCCKRFWSGRKEAGIFAETWQKMILPIDRDLRMMRARFYVSKMLEYDGLLQKGTPSKYCCWGCMTTHEQGAFLPEEFRKSVILKASEDFLPEKEFRRSCPAAKRYILFGACREMSLIDIRHALTNPYIQTSHDDWILDKNNATFLSRDGSVFFRDANTFHYTVIFTTTVRTYSFFKHWARQADYPLCPHVRMGDDEIVRLYNRPRQTYNCRHCTTAIQLDIQSEVHYEVVRHIGWLCSPTDPWWMAQSYEKRHRRLKNRCRESCYWHEGLFSEDSRLTGSRFQSRRINNPFKGVASCTLDGPERYQKFVKSL